MTQTIYFFFVSEDKRAIRPYVQTPDNVALVVYFEELSRHYSVRPDEIDLQKLKLVSSEVQPTYLVRSIGKKSNRSLLDIKYDVLASYRRKDTRMSQRIIRWMKD
jgi:hypothetical protein